MNDKYSLFYGGFENVFALTGGVGCGKSTVSRLFENIGCYVVDSDKICHELYTERGFIDTLVERWGNQIVSGRNVNKEKVADIVFKNGTELEWLNSIVHPEIIKRALENIENCKKEVVLFDVPLLFELELESCFKATIAVWTSAKKQYEWLKIRNSWSDKEIELRVYSQLSSDTKLQKATYGIINTGSLAFLEIQCKKILFKIKEEGTSWKKRT